MKQQLINTVLTCGLILSFSLLTKSQISPNAIKYTTDPRDPVTIGNGDIQIKEIENLSDFNKIVVGNGFSVVLVSNDVNQASLEAESNILSLIKYDVIDNVLTFGLKESIDAKNGVLLRIGVKELAHLTIKEGVIFNISLSDLDDLKVIVKSGSMGEAHFDQIKVLDLIIMGGSELDASGYVANSKIVINGGSALSGKKMKTNQAVIDVLGNSKSTIKVLERVSARADNESYLRVKGNPDFEKKETTRNSTIISL